MLTDICCCVCVIEEIPPAYWEMCAEQRRQALADALHENEEVQKLLLSHSVRQSIQTKLLQLVSYTFIDLFCSLSSCWIVKGLAHHMYVSRIYYIYIYVYV